MKLIRIYYSDSLVAGMDILLPQNASHHLQVLRVKPHDRVIIFNGNGAEYFAQITALTRKQVALRVLHQHVVVRESTLSLHLAQSISRGERMDYVMQKSVELGVTEITPIFSERCEVRLSAERLQKRMQHWHGVILSACEQSGRLVLPTLHHPVTFKEFITLSSVGLCLICDVVAQKSQLPAHVAAITFLVGPEGGFSAGEIHAASQERWLRLSLGPRVLRTETAAVVALTMAQCKWGDFSL